MTRPAPRLAPRRVRRGLAPAVARAGLYLGLAVACSLGVSILVGAGTAAPPGAGGPRPVDVAPQPVGDGQSIPPIGGSDGEEAAPEAQPQPSPVPGDPQVARMAVMAQQQASANGHVASGGWGVGAATTNVARISNSAGPVRPQTQAAADAVVSNVAGADAISLGGTRRDAVDPDGHPAGLAIDYMALSDRALGEAIVAYHVAQWNQLRVHYIIYRQRILMSPNGVWQAMQDRGSPTANHMDHVHVSYQR